jgi:hypothetical protein
MSGAKPAVRRRAGPPRPERQTFAVVGIGLVVLGIELGAVEIVRAIEQIDADPVQFQLIDAIADITAILGVGSQREARSLASSRRLMVL